MLRAMLTQVQQFFLTCRSACAGLSWSHSHTFSEPRHARHLILWPKLAADQICSSPRIRDPASTSPRSVRVEEHAPFVALLAEEKGALMGRAR